jgi:hypothetical protein
MARSTISSIAAGMSLTNDRTLGPRGLDVQPQQLEFVAALERQPPRESFEQHHAHRIHVRKRGRLHALGGFGRDVFVGADDHAVARIPVGAAHARDAEIGHFEAVALVDHQVGRLDVAVHDLLLVRVIESVQSLNRIAGGLVVSQPSLLVQHLRQGRAIDVLHRQVMFVAQLKKLPYLRDVRMIQLGLRLRFLTEPLEHARVVRHLRPQTLQRHFAMQLLIHRVVHRSHPALAERMVNLVVFDVPAHSDRIVLRAAPLGGCAIARSNIRESSSLVAATAVRPCSPIWSVTLERSQRSGFHPDQV